MRGLGDVTLGHSSRLLFHIEFCPPAFVETKRLEFETLTQGSMTVSEYERRFRELSDFCLNLVADEVSKKRRFLDGLSELIALSLSGSDHPTYQSMRDAALAVERQTLICQTKRRSYNGLSLGSVGVICEEEGWYLEVVYRLQTVE